MTVGFGPPAQPSRASAAEAVSLDFGDALSAQNYGWSAATTSLFQTTLWPSQIADSGPEDQQTEQTKHLAFLQTGGRLNRAERFRQNPGGFAPTGHCTTAMLKQPGLLLKHQTTLRPLTNTTMDQLNFTHSSPGAFSCMGTG